MNFLSRALFLLGIMSCAIAAESIQLFKQLDSSVKDQNDKSTQLIIQATPFKNTTEQIAYRLHQQFELDALSELKEIAVESHGKKQSVHFQQYYAGIPVYLHESVVLLDENQQIIQAYGKVASDIQLNLEYDIDFYKRTDFSKQIEDYISSAIADEPRFFRNLDIQLAIFLDSDKKSHLAISASYFTDLIQGVSKPEKVHLLMDVDSGDVLQKKHVLMQQLVGGSGPSGNAKVSREDYSAEGAEQSPLSTFMLDQVTEENEVWCYFDALNVKTIDAGNNTESFPDNAFAFDCSTNAYTEYYPVNTAKAPINDAHYHAQVAVSMFEEYLGEAPYRDLPVIQYVHYGNAFDNAFYEEGKVYYGDGNFLFYPLVSLDTVTHEIAHGYTAGYGYSVQKLMNSGEAYAINESFSDISGAAASYYLTGENSWQAGYEIYQSSGALRYLNKPSLDGVSPDHVDTYDSDLDPHYGAGIFNKVFYHLATNDLNDSTLPWNPKLAFLAYAKGNRACWLSNSSFIEAADCILHQADTVLAQIQQDNSDNPLLNDWAEFAVRNDIRKAFSQVGIELSAYQNSDDNSVEAAFDLTPIMLDVTLTNNSRFNGVKLTEDQGDEGWQWQWWFEGEQISNEFQTTYTFEAAGTYEITLVVTSPTGIKDQLTRQITVVDEYCQISVDKENSLFLANVAINGTHNVTGATGYGDYSDTTINLKPSQALELKLEYGRTNALKYGGYLILWIDKNRNGLFEQHNEQVYKNRSEAEVTSAQITTSFSGEVGLDYRIRVMFLNDSSMSVCGNLYEGEAEDYTVSWIDDTTDHSDVAYITEDNKISFFTTSNLDNISNWQWNFGDGSSVFTGNDPEVSYTKSGDYEVTAQALKNDNSILYTWKETITFQSKTEAIFSLEDEAYDISLDASQSTYPKGSVLSWSFGDGNNATGETVDHTYSDEGSYTITLNISNEDNPDGVISTKTVTIGNSDFTPTFYFDIARYDENGWLTKWFFTSAEPDDIKEGQQDFITWEFGDGTSPIETEAPYLDGPYHTFQTDGDYEVKLTYRYPQTTGSGENDWQWRTISATQSLALNSSNKQTYCNPEFNNEYEFINSIQVNSKTFQNGAEGGLVNPNEPILLNAERNRYRIDASYTDPDKVVSELYTIWLDIDRDGLFGGKDWQNNTSERLVHVLDMEEPTKGKGFIAGTFTLPSEMVNPGEFSSRMRVMQRYSLLGSELPYPCINSKYHVGFYGEIEDYLVEWKIPPSILIERNPVNNKLSLSNLTENDTEIVWQWQVNNGNIIEAREPSEIDILESGEYTVSATASGLKGTELASWSQTFNIETVTIADLYTSVSGRTLTYNTDQSVYPTGTELLIDFGDGDSSTEKNSQHKYNNDGQFTVKLTLTNSDNPDGVSQTVNITIASNNDEESKGGSLGGVTAILILLLIIRLRKKE